MDFNTPAGPNALDRQRVLGQPTDRVDGPAKVSGQARYAYEYHAANAAYGVVLGAGIAKGRIETMDTREAEAAPGVLLVVTHRNAPRQGPVGEYSRPHLSGPEVNYFDQSVALVVAETLEQAEAAARLIKVQYCVEQGSFDLAAGRETAHTPKFWSFVADTAVGDFAYGFETAAVKLDETYTTPDQNQAVMEPHASMASWAGEQLTIHTSHQHLNWALRDIANTLLIQEQDIRVVSPYVGGGFGSKLFIWGDCILAAIGARMLQRPVKVALTRQQTFGQTSHRPATIQRLRIAAGRDGRIVAIGHDVLSGNVAGFEFFEMAALATRSVYLGEHRQTTHRLANLNLGIGASMRAPGEAPGMLALEVAMDELAERLDMDPVELRIVNDAQFDPETGPSRPFSSRRLVECLQTGADRFGWSQRSPAPSRVRDGQWLVGTGVASAYRSNQAQACAVRVHLGGDGRILVESSTTDIGTGTYTILAQVVAEMLGVGVLQVDVRLGDTRYPSGAGSGGSWNANSSVSAAYAACEELRGKLAAIAGLPVADATFEDGCVSGLGRSASLTSLAGAAGVSADGCIAFGDLGKQFIQASFGAFFCEVGVDADTAEVRVRRMLGVFSAGRIYNPKAARSQSIGGMVFGIGGALLEELVVDKRFGSFVNQDLSDYQVPLHADVANIDAVFLPDVDDKSSPAKGKGVGELGICGSAAAVANAVYNACGVRVREFPITVEKLLGNLP